jgi:hypothetical protein
MCGYFAMLLLLNLFIKVKKWPGLPVDFLQRGTAMLTMFELLTPVSRCSYKMVEVGEITRNAYWEVPSYKVLSAANKGA